MGNKQQKGDKQQKSLQQKSMIEEFKTMSITSNLNLTSKTNHFRGYRPHKTTTHKTTTTATPVYLTLPKYLKWMTKVNNMENNMEIKNNNTVKPGIYKHKIISNEFCIDLISQSTQENKYRFKKHLT